MAKKTNKTDHVLNLLSSGKKTGAKEENDAPPVDLRRKAQEPPEETFAKPPDEELPEPEASAEPEAELPEPKMTEREEGTLPEPKITKAAEEDPLPEPRISAEPEKTPETKVTVEMTPKAPGVSVVHASSDENPIADAVKDSLEAEFNEYLREKGEIPATPETERLIEWDLSKPKERTEINVFELMRESEDEDEAQAEPAPEPVIAQEKTDAAPEPVMEQETKEPPPEPMAEQEPVQEPEAVAASPEPEQAETSAETNAGEPASDESPEQTEPEAAEAVPEPQPAEEPKTAAPEEEPMEEKDYTMVNVMEYLVREQAPGYIRQFGHCDCDRCIEDTVALTLTHLPAKYVVVNKNAVSPLLNFYEKKYAGQLIVEITKATMIVNESPNH